MNNPYAMNTVGNATMGFVQQPLQQQQLQQLQLQQLQQQQQQQQVNPTPTTASNNPIQKQSSLHQQQQYQMFLQQQQQQQLQQHQLQQLQMLQQHHQSMNMGNVQGLVNGQLQQQQLQQLQQQQMQQLQLQQGVAATITTPGAAAAGATTAPGASGVLSSTTTVGVEGTLSAVATTRTSDGPSAVSTAGNASTAAAMTAGTAAAASASAAMTGATTMLTQQQQQMQQLQLQHQQQQLANLGLTSQQSAYYMEQLQLQNRQQSMVLHQQKQQQLQLASNPALLQQLIAQQQQHNQQLIQQQQRQRHALLQQLTQMSQSTANNVAIPGTSTVATASIANGGAVSGAASPSAHAAALNPPQTPQLPTPQVQAANPLLTVQQHQQMQQTQQQLLAQQQQQLLLQNQSLTPATSLNHPSQNQPTPQQVQQQLLMHLQMKQQQGNPLTGQQHQQLLQLQQQAMQLAANNKINTAMAQQQQKLQHQQMMQLQQLQQLQMIQNGSTAEWPSDLTAEERSESLRKIATAVHAVLPVEQRTRERINTITMEIERYVYSKATSKNEYLSLISMRMSQLQNKGTVPAVQNSTNPGSPSYSGGVTTPSAITTSSPRPIQPNRSASPVVKPGGPSTSGSFTHPNSTASAGSPRPATVGGGSMSPTTLNSNHPNSSGNAQNTKMGASAAKGANAAKNMPVTMSLSTTSQSASLPASAFSPRMHPHTPQTTTEAHPFRSGSMAESPIKLEHDTQQSVEANFATADLSLDDKSFIQGADMSQSAKSSAQHIPISPQLQLILASMNNDAATNRGNTLQQDQDGCYINGSGAKYTPCELSDQEKEIIMETMQHITPMYLKINSIANDLATFGGENEHDKIKRLSVMKQMLSAQLEVLDKGIFFVRVEVLSHLYQNMLRFLHYTESLKARNMSQQQMLISQPNANLKIMQQQQFQQQLQQQQLQQQENKLEDVQAQQLSQDMMNFNSSMQNAVGTHANGTMGSATAMSAVPTNLKAASGIQTGQSNNSSLTSMSPHVSPNIVPSSPSTTGITTNGLSMMASQVAAGGAQNRLSQSNINMSATPSNSNTLASGTAGMVNGPTAQQIHAGQLQQMYHNLQAQLIHCEDIIGSYQQRGIAPDQLMLLQNRKQVVLSQQAQILQQMKVLQAQHEDALRHAANQSPVARAQEPTGIQQMMRTQSGNTLALQQQIQAQQQQIQQQKQQQQPQLANASRNAQQQQQLHQQQLFKQQWQMQQQLMLQQQQQQQMSPNPILGGHDSPTSRVFSASSPQVAQSTPTTAVESVASTSTTTKPPPKPRNRSKKDQAKKEQAAAAKSGANISAPSTPFASTAISSGHGNATATSGTLSSSTYLSSTASTPAATPGLNTGTTLAAASTRTLNTTATVTTASPLPNGLATTSPSTTLALLSQGQVMTHEMGLTAGAEKTMAASTQALDQQAIQRHLLGISGVSSGMTTNAFGTSMGMVSSVPTSASISLHQPHSMVSENTASIPGMTSMGLSSANPAFANSNRAIDGSGFDVSSVSDMNGFVQNTAASWGIDGMTDSFSLNGTTKDHFSNGSSVLNTNGQSSGTALGSVAGQSTKPATSEMTHYDEASLDEFFNLDYESPPAHGSAAIANAKDASDVAAALLSDTAMTSGTDALSAFLPSQTIVKRSREELDSENAKGVDTKDALGDGDGRRVKACRPQQPMDGSHFYGGFGSSSGNNMSGMASFTADSGAAETVQSEQANLDVLDFLAIPEDEDTDPVSHAQSENVMGSGANVEALGDNVAYALNDLLSTTGNFTSNMMQHQQILPEDTVDPSLAIFGTDDPVDVTPVFNTTGVNMPVQTFSTLQAELSYLQKLYALGTRVVPLPEGSGPRIMVVCQFLSQFPTLCFVFRIKTMEAYQACLLAPAGKSGANTARAYGKMETKKSTEITLEELFDLDTLDSDGDAMVSKDAQVNDVDSSETQVPQCLEFEPVSEDPQHMDLVARLKSVYAQSRFSLISQVLPMIVGEMSRSG
ncbi:hypothetical protein O5D80_002551 [Batrachochytrium dendrobatidis]|nr:hypothetical protein O5D80_002551 [Batrachochytrium dendrobatidis]